MSPELLWTLFYLAMVFYGLLVLWVATLLPPWLPKAYAAAFLGFAFCIGCLAGMTILHSCWGVSKALPIP
jgi:hypothetical protein